MLFNLFSNGVFILILSFAFVYFSGKLLFKNPHIGFYNDLFLLNYAMELPIYTVFYLIYYMNFGKESANLQLVLISLVTCVINILFLFLYHKKSIEKS